MNEKRLYPRYRYSKKVKFRFFEGDPDVINTAVSVPKKGKGRILDISKGGICIATDNLVSINLPVFIEIHINSIKRKIIGNIIRTGRIEGNLSAFAKALSLFKSRKKNFIAIQFSEPFEDLPENGNIG